MTPTKVHRILSSADDSPKPPFKDKHLFSTVGKLDGLQFEIEFTVKQNKCQFSCLQPRSSDTKAQVVEIWNKQAFKFISQNQTNEDSESERITRP
jgi:hypothetical protein